MLEFSLVPVMFRIVAGKIVAVIFGNPMRSMREFSSAVVDASGSYDEYQSPRSVAAKCCD